MSAAIALARQGIPAEIVEISRDWSVYQAGIVAQGNFIRAMAALGMARQAVQAGFVLKGLQLRDPPGNLLAQLPGAPPGGPGLPADLGISRSALHKVLTDGGIRLGVVVSVCVD